MTGGKLMTTVLSAFPGTGKTFLAANTSDVVLDSDSSSYSWISKGVRHPDFPANYISHIQENLGKANLILVSSHLEVRSALVAACIPFVLMYPERHLKPEYLLRYKQRGSSEAFIVLVDTMWNSWIDELESQPSCVHVVLKDGQYVSDTGF